MIRTLAQGQCSRIVRGGPQDAEPVELFRSDRVLFEAPNWSRDGQSLSLNGDGLLWRLDLDTPGEARPIKFTGLPPVSNDHVLDPDGLYASYISFPPGTLGHPADLDVVVRVVSGQHSVCLC